MRNPERWLPSKYVLRAGRLRATRNRSELGVGSRLIADLVAARYDEYLPRFAKGRLVDLGCGKAPLFGSYRNLVSGSPVDWPQSAHLGLHVDAEVDLVAGCRSPTARSTPSFYRMCLKHVPSPDLLWQRWHVRCFRGQRVD
jgi:hypothetical protein